MYMYTQNKNVIQHVCNYCGWSVEPKVTLHSIHNFSPIYAVHTHYCIDIATGLRSYQQVSYQYLDIFKSEI